jgi:hypothetical protein
VLGLLVAKACLVWDSVHCWVSNTGSDQLLWWSSKRIRNLLGQMIGH